MDGYLSTNDVLERIDINYDHLRRRLREDPTLGEKDENGRLWVREDRLGDLRRYARLSEAEHQEIARLEEDGLVAKQIARRINTDRRKRGEQKKVSERTVQAFLRKQRAAPSEAPRGGLHEILTPLRKQLDRRRKVLQPEYEAKGLSLEILDRYLEDMRIQLLHSWQRGPFARMSEQDYEHLGQRKKAEVDKYVETLADGIEGGLIMSARAASEKSENPSIEKPGTTPTRKQAVPSPPNPTGNASVPGSPSAENRKARAQNRGSDRVRVVMTEPGEPKSLGGFARISDLKRELGWPEEKIRELFGLLNDAKIGNYEFLTSDLRERGYSGEDIRKIFVAFEEAFGELPHEKPRQEE